MRRSDLQYFDRREDFLVYDRRRLPHWMQAGTLCFITWRVGDSLPQSVLKQLDADIDEYLRSEGIVRRDDFIQQLAARGEQDRIRIHWRIFTIRDAVLDRGLGRCPLREPSHAAVVRDSLLHFDEEHYFVTDLVVMPNHVHFIAAFASEDLMLKQCKEWKRFTGRRINASERRTGEFWQVDQFDHLIRSEGQFNSLREYIATNPQKAGLSPGEYLHFQKDLTVGNG